MWSAKTVQNEKSWSTGDRGTLTSLFYERQYKMISAYAKQDLNGREREREQEANLLIVRSTDVRAAGLEAE